MNLDELRIEIDALDSQMIELFKRRMDVSGRIARYKMESGKKVFDPVRERQKLWDIAQMSGEDMRDYTTALYSLMFDLSKNYQRKLIGSSNDLSEKINRAIEETPKLFPGYAAVACQGVEGAYSQSACQKLFAVPSIMFFKNFEGVFSAIEQGLCQYGVLPIENSTAGSVNQVYDLMMRHKFSIVRSVRIKIDHSLVAAPGTRMEDIKEIMSHPQALSQCSEFIKSLKNVTITEMPNTAEAAKYVAESGRSDVAALASSDCAQIYGLDSLKGSVQNDGGNFTRFICISKGLEIYPGADKTSIMAVTAHKPGALYKVLSRFYAHNINLTKLESRPLPDKSFEFMFYFDLEKSVYSPELSALMGELEELCESFEYLGSYTEVV